MSSDDLLERMALEYHRLPQPGKIAVVPTKPLANQRDLALAYSPGVAAACAAIVADPAEVATLTARANLVAVVTNGTAVLGLGAIGPLAAKPVMEGKAVLFKKFAGIDVFDLEIAETDPAKFVEIVASLEPTFGAINLEDIRAPDCFEIEKKLRARMKIPVFHDDQHGTAVVASAALLNGLTIVGKSIERVKLVSTGGGAAGIACLDLLVRLGLSPENIVLVDHKGVVFKGRTEEMTEQKARYARDVKARTLAEAIPGADVFLGLSAPNILTADMVMAMAPRPLILALANPTPEIMPDVAKKARPDAVIATGRSDFPNQVNNVLCFPFIFRGALDVGATTITEEMSLAAVRAIVELARAEITEAVASAYGGEEMRFGPDYLIPKPFDQRLIVAIAPAVAKAAMASGVAERPIADFDAYRERLGRFVFRSGMLMKPVFERARKTPKRVAYAEGEDERVLRAVQVVLDEKLAKPILIGRPEVVAKRIERLGLRFLPGRDCEIVNPESDPRFNDYWQLYHTLTERSGVSPDLARTRVRTNPTVIAALMLHRGEADAMLCGASGRYNDHLHFVRGVVGQAPGARVLAALVALILPHGTFFLADTHVTPEPSAVEIAEIAFLAAAEVRRFGETPKIALLSHSNFGSRETASSLKVREAVRLLAERAPELEIEGEMNGDAAVNEDVRRRIFPNSRLAGQANLLVMPNLDAANIAFNLLKALGEGLSVGPILLGAGLPAHILSSAVTTRGLVNMTAFAVVDAQTRAKPENRAAD
ncbi:MAG: NADP-dependent malic enzyme [Rhodospirillales bacterium]|nr:NADP-dependent malic enzyme [Rhodospirillales bacterium]MSP80422.1 NADP-dependent malic enzyme [Rhodospirillales bacterium]